MISISAEARQWIREKNEPVHLDLPKAVSSCCFDLQECPVVRFGKPQDAVKYEEKIIDEMTVWVPRKISEEEKLQITVSKFLGFKRLVVEGWRLV